MRVSTHAYAEATHVMDLRRDRSVPLNLGKCKIFKSILKLKMHRRGNREKRRLRKGNELELQQRIRITLGAFLSRKFWSGGKLVRGTKISGISVRADLFFLKILVPP